MFHVEHVIVQFWTERTILNMGKKNDFSIRGDFLNFLTGSIVETVAATYKEVEVDTNLSAERGVMMEIHSIEFDLIGGELLAEVAAGASETMGIIVARESQSGMINLSNRDCIYHNVMEISRAPTIGTDAGPLYYIFDRYKKVEFAMPIPYVKPSIFVGVQGSDATGFTGAAFRSGGGTPSGTAAPGSARARG